MSIDRLQNLEGRVERLQNALDAVKKAVAAVAQQAWQLASRGPGGGGGGALVRVWLPTGVGAGSFGSPASAADAVRAVRSGDGWTTSGGDTITVLNADTTAVGSGKAGWAQPRGDGSYELVVADC